jgi:hypothetical protein
LTWGCCSRVLKRRGEFPVETCTLNGIRLSYPNPVLGVLPKDPRSIIPVLTLLLSSTPSRILTLTSLSFFSSPSSLCSAMMTRAEARGALRRMTLLCGGDIKHPCCSSATAAFIRSCETCLQLQLCDYYCCSQYLLYFVVVAAALTDTSCHFL